MHSSLATTWWLARLARLAQLAAHGGWLAGLPPFPSTPTLSLAYRGCNFAILLVAIIPLVASMGLYYFHTVDDALVTSNRMACASTAILQ